MCRVDVRSRIGAAGAASAPSAARSAATRTAPAAKTTSPSRTAPVWGTPSAACQRDTAAASVPVKLPSTARLAALAKPRSIRSRSSWRTSSPLAPGPSSRYAGTAPSSSTTGRPATRYSAWPCCTTVPGAGSHVTLPSRRALDCACWSAAWAFCAATRAAASSASAWCCACAACCRAVASCCWAVARAAALVPAALTAACACWTASWPAAAVSWSAWPAAACAAWVVASAAWAWRSASAGVPAGAVTVQGEP